MSLNIQFYTMITMISLGGYLGAALDTYRYFFNRSKVVNWLIFINDILFWTFQSLFIFYVLFLVNEGELRFYAFLALLCGFSAYQSLFKKLYLSLLQFFVRVIVKAYHIVVSLVNVMVVKPVQLLFKLCLLCLLSLYKLIIVILKSVLKVVVSIIKWILLIIWRMLPGRVKRFLLICSAYVEGFYEKTKNIKVRVINWIKNFKSKGDD